MGLREYRRAELINGAWWLTRAARPAVTSRAPKMSDFTELFGTGDKASAEKFIGRAIAEGERDVVVRIK